MKITIKIFLAVMIAGILAMNDGDLGHTNYETMPSLKQYDGFMELFHFCCLFLLSI